MSEVNKQELRRLAEDAHGSFGSFDPSEAEQEFMAKIGPAEILSLLDEIDQIRGDSERLRKHAGRYQFLRNVASPAVLGWLHFKAKRDEWDGYIDSAMAKDNGA